MRNGKLIAIEGLDGSGKNTQSRLLCENIMKLGEVSHLISFPIYDSPSSSLVKMYLNKELGSMDEISPYGASLFYTVDRYASYLKDWGKYYKAGEFIVADRYTTSNMIHQMGKLNKLAWDEYIQWLETEEYLRIGLPRPNLVIYLDVDPELSRRLITLRYEGNESKRDLHEADFAYQQQCRNAALYAATQLGWVIINCCNSGELLPIEAIQSMILSEVTRRWFS